MFLVALLVSGATSPRRAEPSDASPLRVMTIGDFRTDDAENPVWADAVVARFAPLNLRGGIPDRAGRRHEVVVLRCNAALDAARAVACAKRATRDRVAAVVGMTAVDAGDGTWRRLERARIPVIGTRIQTLADATRSISFPLSAGIPGLFTALPQAVSRAGATTIGVVMSDDGDATDALLAFIDRGIAQVRANPGPVVRVPLGVSSLDDAAAAVTVPGVDGIAAFVTGPRAGVLLRALAARPFGGAYATVASYGSAPLASAPDETQGALVVGEFVPVDANVAGMRMFREDLDQAPAGATLARTEGAVNGWLAAWVFERVVRRLERVDARSVLRELGRLERFDMGGVTPPLTTTVAGTVFPRLFNPTVTFSRSLNGVTAPLVRGFVNPFDGTTVAP